MNFLQYRNPNVILNSKNKMIKFIFLTKTNTFWVRAIPMFSFAPGITQRHLYNEHD